MTMRKNEVTPEVLDHRNANYAIDSQFLNRWSPRSFIEKEVPDEVLFSLFEAARWAPSASNHQPWRYIIARTESDKETFYQFINEGNREWCEKAPVLTLLISSKIAANGNNLRTHAFDAGTSWGYLALEATHKGLITHAMGGFDNDKARQMLHVPDDYAIHAVIAIGYRGEINDLPENQQEREKPSTRRPLQETMYEGKFGEKVDVT